MNVATLLTLTACAIEVVMGTLSFLFGRARGWHHFTTFGWIAFSAAAYSANNAVFVSTAPDVDLLVWSARLNFGLACVHCAGWILYVRRQYGDGAARLDRGLVFALAAIGTAGLVPRLVMEDRVVQQTIDWAGVAYHVTPVTPFGSIVMLIVPLALLVPAWTYVRKARAGAPGALVHAIAFLVLLACMVNESLVGLGVLDNLYLLDLGFLAAVLSVCAEMTYRVSGDALRLRELSESLALQVDERTRELVQARDNLVRSERLAALGRLSASIGHEINNPLSYVIGNLNYIADELADEQSERQDALIESAVQDALGGAERIRKIVGELRAFGLSSEREVRQVIDVCELLETAVKLVRGEVKHRARLEREYEIVPKVLADPNKLTQVFVNLLVNAAQAIPEERLGSPLAVVTLRTRKIAGERLAIEVTDTGTGITEEVRQRLFEPFFTTKPSDRGTGLGLFVSLGIVTGFGGSIEVDSRVGEGTTLRVVLPAWHGVEPAPETRPRVSLRTVKNRRLLVVDDDALVARTLARQLTGHSVDVVANGHAALERLAETGGEYDLVLCDLMMPDMTGMDVYEEVEQRHPQLADRFVFISGGGVTERSRRFLEVHADRVLPKPIDSRQLCEVLQRCGPREPEIVVIERAG
jgi:signal transduction histidine kinase/CheY-like chemotaxis protein